MSLIYMIRLPCSFSIHPNILEKINYSRRESFYNFCLGQFKFQPTSKWSLKRHYTIIFALYFPLSTQPISKWSLKLCKLKYLFRLIFRVNFDKPKKKSFISFCITVKTTSSKVSKAYQAWLLSFCWTSQGFRPRLGSPKNRKNEDGFLLARRWFSSDRCSISTPLIAGGAPYSYQNIARSQQHQGGQLPGSESILPTDSKTNPHLT